MVCSTGGGSRLDAGPLRSPGLGLSEPQAGPLGGARGLLRHIALSTEPSVWRVVLQQVRREEWCDNAAFIPARDEE